MIQRPPRGRHPRRQPASAPPLAAPPGDDTNDDLLCALETDLTQPIAVGKGTAICLSGWCYHPRARIRDLVLEVDGMAHPIAQHGIARPDVLAAQPTRRDPARHSLSSGFLALVEFAAIGEPRHYALALQARLTSGAVYRQPLPTLTLVPDAPTPPHDSLAHTSAVLSASEPLIAICMATYDPPPALFRAQIASLQGQTHANWVCLISDDASPVEAVALIEREIAGDDRFRLQRHGARVGFYANFERCLRLVPSDAAFVALCDQDDEWYPTKLRASLAAFTDTTRLVYTDMDVVTADGSLHARTSRGGRRNTQRDLAALLLLNTVTGAACVFRASLLREILPFPPYTAGAFHDHWIACAALAVGEIAFVDQALWAYRQHERNVVGHDQSAAWHALPSLPRLLRRARGARSLASLLWEELLSKRQVFSRDVVKVVLFARVLRQRVRPASPAKRGALLRCGRLHSSLAALAGEALRSLVAPARRSTLGTEWSFLRAGVAYRVTNWWARRLPGHWPGVADGPAVEARPAPESGRS